MAKRDDIPEDLGLTEDEEAALAEFDEEEGAAGEPDDGDDDEAGDDAPADAAAAAGEETQQQADADAKPDPAAAAAELATAQPDPAAASQPQRQAVPDWTAPADAEQRLAELAQQRDALAEQFDNGELTARELTAAQRKVDEAEREIRDAQLRAQMAGEMAQAVWTKSTVPTFLAQHAAYADNQPLLTLLDHEVRRQQVAAAEAGKDPFDPAILAQADAAVMAAIRKVQAPAATATTPAAASGKQPAPKPAIPPTLGGLPVAEISGTGDGKYASLDRLADSDPAAFEDALARLPDADRNAYLAQH